MHLSQLCLVTLKCLLHFVNPTITPIHSLQQGLILSPGTAPPHHFAPTNSVNTTPTPNCPGCGHNPTTSPSHTEDVDTILLLSPVLPTILLPPLSSVFSPVHTFSFLVPIHSYTFSCVPANEARRGRVKHIIMSIKTKSTF